MINFKQKQPVFDLKLITRKQHITNKSFHFLQIGQLIALGFAVNTGAALAQTVTPITTVIKSPLGESSANILSGSTINLSSQSGSKSNLTFGTNTSFGASLSTQFSEGMTVTSSSRFNPVTAEIRSDIGITTGNLGKTTANISNLSAGGGANTGSTTIAGTTINADKASLASGNAILEGLSAGVNIVLDKDKSGFNVEAMPNVIGSAGCNLASATACTYTFAKDQKTLNVLDKDGKIVGTVDAYGMKPYDGQQFSSGSATASVNSNTNVDIGTSQFSSVFAQSF